MGSHCLTPHTLGPEGLTQEQKSSGSVSAKGTARSAHTERQNEHPAECTQTVCNPGQGSTPRGTASNSRLGAAGEEGDTARRLSETRQSNRVGGRVRQVSKAARHPDTPFIAEGGGGKVAPGTRVSARPARSRTKPGSLGAAKPPPRGPPAPSGDGGASVPSPRGCRDAAAAAARDARAPAGPSLTSR